MAGKFLLFLWVLVLSYQYATTSTRAWNLQKKLVELQKEHLALRQRVLDAQYGLLYNPPLNAREEIYNERIEGWVQYILEVEGGE